MSGERTFGALVGHDGITLVEYRAERSGIRVVEQWSDAGRSTSIDEALARLVSLVAARGTRRAHVALAIEQFGVLHHLMTLPPAADAVIEPIVKREIQRAFGVADPVIAFTRGASHERREPSRADQRTAPKQLFVAAAPRATIDAFAGLNARAVAVDVATVVPKALHALYEASDASIEPTVVLACLESGPHLAFFLDGRLELAIDPPIALEGDRPTVPVILDQVERGAVYFRQQFRGAAPSRVLLAARTEDYEPLAAALEARLGARVKPLFSGVETPEAVVAMGAVLESRHDTALDLFPHPPTLSEQVAVALRGPNALVAGAAAAALVAMAWGAWQVVALSSARHEAQSMRAALAASMPAVEPMRRVAEHRADVVKQAAFVRGTITERAVVTRALSAMSAAASDGISFDSVHVSRSANGWSGLLQGRARGTTTAQAVYALDTFLKSVRSQHDVASATLDDFEYPTSSPGDSTYHFEGVVLIDFRISFALRHGEGTP